MAINEKLQSAINQYKIKVQELQLEYDNHEIYDESKMIAPERLYKNIQLHTSLINHKEFLVILMSISQDLMIFPFS